MRSNENKTEIEVGNIYSHLLAGQVNGVWCAAATREYFHAIVNYLYHYFRVGWSTIVHRSQTHFEFQSRVCLRRLCWSFRFCFQLCTIALVYRCARFLRSTKLCNIMLCFVDCRCETKKKTKLTNFGSASQIVSNHSFCSTFYGSIDCIRSYRYCSIDSTLSFEFRFECQLVLSRSSFEL